MRTNFLFIGFVLVLFSCSEPEPIKKIQLTNPTDFPREEVVTLDVSDWKTNNINNVKVSSDDENLAFERVDSNGDGTADQIRLIVNLQPNETKSLLVKEGNGAEANEPQKLTQAELSVRKGGEWKDRKYVGGAFENMESLSVPEEHTDHSYFIRYEGPGWESNLMGYRFYLDWRNGVDIFGKKTNEMVLQKVGQDNFDSYHDESDWGMDILKVGPSLGIGSIGRHENDSLYRFQDVDSVYCEISENGLLKSLITTKYYNWKTEGDSTDLISKISIEAESRRTQHNVSLSNPISGFCTGLVKNEGEKFIDISEGDYRLLATYGDFSLNNDKMGMAVIVKNDEVENVFDDEYSHVVTFKPSQQVTYHFLAVWEKEPEGIKSLGEFQEYLTSELAKLNNPIVVKAVD